MKSIVYMFIVFLGLYMLIYNGICVDVVVFFAQKKVLCFSVGLAVLMLGIALFLLTPIGRKLIIRLNNRIGGEDDDKNIHLN